MARFIIITVLLFSSCCIFGQDSLTLRFKDELKNYIYERIKSNNTDSTFIESYKPEKITIWVYPIERKEDEIGIYVFGVVGSSHTSNVFTYDGSVINILNSADLAITSRLFSERYFSRRKVKKIAKKIETIINEKSIDIF